MKEGFLNTEKLWNTLAENIKTIDKIQKEILPCQMQIMVLKYILY